MLDPVLIVNRTCPECRGWTRMPAESKGRAPCPACSGRGFVGTPADIATHPTLKARDFPDLARLVAEQDRHAAQAEHACRVLGLHHEADAFAAEACVWTIAGAALARLGVEVPRGLAVEAGTLERITAALGVTAGWLAGRE